MGLHKVCNRLAMGLQQACNACAMDLQRAYNELAMGLQYLLSIQVGQTISTSPEPNPSSQFLHLLPKNRLAGASAEVSQCPRDASRFPRAVSYFRPSRERFYFKPPPCPLLCFPQFKEKQLQKWEIKEAAEAKGGWKNPTALLRRTPKVRWLRGAAAGDAQEGRTAEMKEALEPPSNWNQKGGESRLGISAQGGLEQRGFFDLGIGCRLPPCLGGRDAMDLQ